MKIKVLHLLSSNNYSGAENVAINIIKSLENDYEFVYVSPNGPIEKVLEEKNINYLSLNSTSIRCLNSVLHMWKPDIIHAHDFRASVKVALLSYKCKKISHLHQNPNWIKNINARTLLYTLSCFVLDEVVTVSPEVLNEAIFSKIIKKKSSVLYNIVDTKNILNSIKDCSQDNDFDLAFVGRLSKEKNPLRFIKIVKDVAIHKKDIKAVIVGDGELMYECKKLINELGLNEKIFMTGFLSNPFPIMNSSKVLVITSEWEGFGLVAVEAMALGKPVFATPVGGLNSIVNSECGKLCYSNEEFTKEINMALDNSYYYNKLSIGALNNVIKFSNKDVWIEFIKTLYSL